MWKLCDKLFWLTPFFNDPWTQELDSVLHNDFYMCGWEVSPRCQLTCALLRCAFLLRSELGCLEIVRLFSSHFSSDHCHQHMQWTVCAVTPHPESEERKDPWLLMLRQLRCFCTLGINNLSTDGREITESDHFPLLLDSWRYCSQRQTVGLVHFNASVSKRCRENTGLEGWVTAEMVKGCWERNSTLLFCVCLFES